MGEPFRLNNHVECLGETGNKRVKQQTPMDNKQKTVFGSMWNSAIVRGEVTKCAR